LLSAERRVEKGVGKKKTVTNYNMNISSNSTNIINVLSPLTPLGVHLVAVFAGIVGLMMLFYGSKLLKICMFSLGFGAGFFLSAIACNKLNGFEDMTLTPHTTLIVAVVSGVVVGGVAAFLVTITKVLLALGCGVAVSFAVSQSGLTVSNNYVLWAVLIVAFLIMLWATFKVFDHAVVVVTSLVGSMAVIFSISHFVPSLSFSLAQLFSDPSTVRGCTNNMACEIMLVAWGMLLALGLFIQFKRLDGCVGGDKEQDRRESEVALLSFS